MYSPVTSEALARTNLKCEIFLRDAYRRDFVRCAPTNRVNVVLGLNYGNYRPEVEAVDRKYTPNTARDELH